MRSGQKQNNIVRFRRKIRTFYRTQKRDFPWRKTKNPYHIVVSEVMLQQTQTHRVVPKYHAFLKRFPTINSLAQAPLSEVLTVWQGLGYNRRAKMLHETAKKITTVYDNVFPKEYKELVALPGVGEYTAKAIRTFAWDTKEVFIETNIRTVFIHEFFNTKKQVSDKEILTMIQETLPRKNFRAWYAGLMDYGAYIKQTHINPSRKSAVYKKQKSFKGSDREIRGAVIRTLSQQRASRKTLFALPFKKERIASQLERLEKEGLVERTGAVWRLPS